MPRTLPKPVAVDIRPSRVSGQHWTVLVRTEDGRRYVDTWVGMRPSVPQVLAVWQLPGNGFKRDRSR